MQKVAIAFALLLAWLSSMTASWIHIPLFLVVLFLAWWGLCPRETERQIKSLPKGDKIWHYLCIIEETLSADGKKRKQIRVSLGQFLGEGEQLQYRCEDENSSPPAAEVELWKTKVETFFADNMDASFISRFRSPTGVPTGYCSLKSQGHIQLWASLRTRNYHLQQFIKEHLD